MTQPTGASNARALWLPAIGVVILLGVQIVALTWDLGYSPVRRTTKVQVTTIAELDREQGRVQWRSAGELAWEPPLPSLSLADEDALATAAHSSARVVYRDGTELEIGAESLVVIESPPPEEAAETIRTRLVRGSLSRKKAGSRSLVINASRSRERPTLVRIEDPRGNAEFTVKRGAQGAEIRVSRGEIRVRADAKVTSVGEGEAKAIEIREAPSSPTQTEASSNPVGGSPAAQPSAAPSAAPAPSPNASPSAAPSSSPSPRGAVSPTRARRLAPPKIKAPRIRPRPPSSRTPGSLLFSWILPEARAAESVAERITIDLEWEPVEGARSYRIQVSKQASFAQPSVDQRTRIPRFTLELEPSEAGNRYWFRVAGVDQNGLVGKFSENAPVDIPAPAIPAAPVASPTPAASPSPAPFAQAKLSPEPIARPAWIALSGAAGLAFHARQFIQSANPKRASGAGIVPGAWLAQVRFRRAKPWPLALGSMGAWEKVSGLAGATPVSASVPWTSLWCLADGAWGGRRLSPGIYFSWTYRFVFASGEFSTRARWLPGLALGLNSTRTRPTGWRWRLLTAFIGGGGWGADLFASLRRDLGRAAFEDAFRGFFVETALVTRLTTAEMGGAAMIFGGFAYP